MNKTEKLTIGQLREKRDELNRDILEIISVRLSQFYQDTGLSVRYISFDFNNIFFLNEGPRSILTRVNCEVDI